MPAWMMPTEPTLLQSYDCAAAGNASRSARMVIEQNALMGSPFDADGGESVDRQLVQARRRRCIRLRDGDVDVVGVVREIESAVERAGLARDRAVAVVAGDRTEKRFGARTDVDFVERGDDRSRRRRVVL